MTCPRIMTEEHTRGPGGPGVTPHIFLSTCPLPVGHAEAHLWVPTGKSLAMCEEGRTTTMRRRGR